MSTSTSSTSTAKGAASFESRNWKAVAIPSLAGSKTELKVSGEVQTGTVAPKLVLRTTKEKLPANVIALDVTGMAGGQFGEVKFSQDFTSTFKYDIVLVFNEKNEIEAAIRIEKDIVS